MWFDIYVEEKEMAGWGRGLSSRGSGSYPKRKKVQ